MQRIVPRFLLLLLTLAVFTAAASADTLPVGFVALDAGTTAGTGSFDIGNLTGANNLPPDFPVATSLTFSGLSLVVDFVTGPALTLDSTHFTSDGFGGFTGNDVFHLGTNPILSAVLTGTLGPLGITLYDASTATILPGFSSTITDATGGPLIVSDLAVINATTTTGGGGTTVPEPATWTLLGAGICGLFLLRRRRLLPGQTSAA